MADLAADLPRLLDDDGLLLVDRPGGLTRAEAAALRARTPQFVEACEALAEGAVPDSLDHGALAADEVIIGAMGPVFLDWSDGSITTRSCPRRRSSLAATGRDSRRTSVWPRIGPWLSARLGLTTEAAMDALALARTVLPLHRVALYARLLTALNDPPDLAATVPRTLRAILPG